MRFTRHLSGEKIAAYVDGELSKADVAHVQSHLAVCMHCRQKAKTQAQAAHLLHTWGSLPNLTPANGQQILQRIRTCCGGPACATSGQRRPLWQLSTYLIMVLCAAFLLIYGAQSLYTDVIAKSTPTIESEVISYVESHRNLENLYQVLSFP